MPIVTHDANLRFGYVSNLINNITWDGDGFNLCECSWLGDANNIIIISNSKLKNTELLMRHITEEEKRALAKSSLLIFANQIMYQKNILKALSK